MLHQIINFVCLEKKITSSQVLPHKLLLIIVFSAHFVFVSITNPVEHNMFLAINSVFVKSIRTIILAAVTLSYYIGTKIGAH